MADIQVGSYSLYFDLIFVARKSLSKARSSFPQHQKVVGQEDHTRCQVLQADWSR